MKNNNDKYNNLTKCWYVLVALSKFKSLLCVCKRKKGKKKKKKKKPQKIADKIIASFLIEFCRGNWDKV